MRLNWGTGIALVYTVFAACTTTFVVFALNHPVQLVSEDYYLRSLDHDQRRVATENADALTHEVLIAAADGRTITIALPLSQARDARGGLQLYRPSDSSADRRVELTPDAEGRQRVRLEGLAAGRWIAQLAWTSDGRAYYHEAAVQIP